MYRLLETAIKPGLHLSHVQEVKENEDAELICELGRSCPYQRFQDSVWCSINCPQDRNETEDGEGDREDKALRKNLQGSVWCLEGVLNEEVQEVVVQI